jgi:predicted GNAT family acetyltransferase
METRVENNADASRYELFVDDELAAIADYRLTGDVVVFPHTEVRPELRGRGLGEVLVKEALDDVRSSGRTVHATCWFVAEFIENNPEYRDLAA